MSYQGLTQWLSRNHIDASLAKLGVLLSVVLLGLRLLASQVLLVVIPLAMGVGSVLYLLTRTGQGSPVATWNARSTDVSSPTVPRVLAGYLPSLVLFGLAAFVVAIHQTGVRTDPIYALIGGIGIAIFVQILFVGDESISPGVVLFEILVASVVFRIATLYVTPGYVGVDVWTHALVFIDGIATSGSLSPLVEYKYLMAPFYHVIGAIGTLFVGSVRDGLYLTLGLLVPLSAVFVYATGRLVLPARWALFATGLFAFSDQFIRWGTHVIPTSLGLVFFLAVVYALTRIIYADAERWAVGLLLVASLAIVFTHQASTAILLLVLGLVTVVTVATALAGAGKGPGGRLRKAFAFTGVFLVTLVTTIASWAVTPFSGGEAFLWRELAVVRTAILENAGFLDLASESADAAAVLGGPPRDGLLSTLLPYVELFGFALLLMAAVVGGLYLLRWEGSPDLTGTYVLMGSGLFVVTFGLSLFGIRALLPGRWLAFLYVPMALLGAFGAFHVSRGGSRRVVLVVFVLLAAGYPTTMVVAEKATLENPAFEDHYNRFAYTEPEIAAVESISEVNPPAAGQTIATDHPYYTLFDRAGGFGDDAVTLDIGADGPESANATVYRDYQSSGPATFRRAEGSQATGLPANVEATVCPPGWNVGYANDQVKLCTPPEEPEGES